MSRPPAPVPERTRPAAPPAAPMARRAALSAFLGSLVEYYDFFLFGTASALVFGPLFFGPLGEAGALLASLAVFGVAYVARPLGAVLFGGLGDRIGRKRALMWTLYLMGAATFCVGLLPTADAIGVAAPAALVVLRIAQGLSAGGEQAGSNTLALEHAPEGRRGLFASWSMQGTVAGMLLGNLVFMMMTLLPDAQFLAWGWRVPFLLAGPFMAIAIYLRRRVDETASFRTASERRTGRAPLAEVLRAHWRPLLRVIGTNFISVCGTTVSVYGLSLWAGAGGDSGIYLLAGLLSNVVLIALQPLWARLSDRVGRRPVLGFALVGLVLLWFPFFTAVSTGDIRGLALAMAGFALVYSAANGVQASFYAEQFPARVRFTGMAVGMQLGILLGGFAPTIQAALAGATATTGWLLPAVFTSAMCAVAALCAFLSRETSAASIQELDR